MAWCNFGIAQSEQGKMDEAIANFRRALKADRNLVVAHLRLAVLLADRDELDEAILHFRRVIEIEPDLPVSYFRLARLLRQQGKTSQAASFEERGKGANGRRADSQNLRGAELAQQGRLDEAIAQFQLAWLCTSPTRRMCTPTWPGRLALQGRHR